MDGDENKRRVPRYPVAAVVELPEGRGYTRDISATGALIDTDRAYLEGTMLSFALVFEDVADGPRRAQCEGEVVRVESRGDRFRLAVRMLAYRWIDEAGT